MIRYLYILFFLLSIEGVMAQPPQSDKNLADQYFYNGEFDKAVVIYERIFNKDPYAVYYNYCKSLYNLGEFEKVVKVAAKQQKNNPQDVSLYIDQASGWQALGNNKKADELKQRAFKELTPDQGQISNLANSFINKQDLESARLAYVEGKRLLRGSYGFNFELAEIYYQKGDFSAMIDEYIEALESNPTLQQSIQNTLQMRVSHDPDGSRGELLRTTLLKKIQKNPGQQIYAEVLVWLFIQQKDFASAFLQAKALDKRNKEDSNRIFTLASTAAANKQYDVALQCYEYIMEKGKEHVMYMPSKIEALNVRNQKLISALQFTMIDLLQLEAQYLSTLGELGRNGNTLTLQKGLAHLWVFYLNKPDSAIALLEEAITYPTNRFQTQAECKLELGDIYLFQGNVWDSDLLYAQVDKAFKNDVLGQEAKYRSARLDYFRGDFSWAQAQLDVLKSATSQLIANDATKLSLLISENGGIDSAYDALMIFADADLLHYRHQPEQALNKLDSLANNYPSHSLIDDVIFKKAEIYSSQQNYSLADSCYDQLIAMDASGILADDALYQKALLWMDYYKDTEKAKALFEQLLLQFPGSLYSVDARKYYRQLRGDNVPN